MPIKPRYYLIYEAHGTGYVTDEDTLATTPLRDKAQRFTTLPEEIGEEPYPSELNADGTAYIDMGGSVTHYSMRF